MRKVVPLDTSKDSGGQFNVCWWNRLRHGDVLQVGGRNEAGEYRQFRTTVIMYDGQPLLGDGCGSVLSPADVDDALLVTEQF